MIEPLDIEEQEQLENEARWRASERRQQKVLDGLAVLIIGAIIFSAVFASPSVFDDVFSDRHDRTAAGLAAFGVGSAGVWAAARLAQND